MEEPKETISKEEMAAKLKMSVDVFEKKLEASKNPKPLPMNRAMRRRLMRSSK